MSDNRFDELYRKNQAALTRLQKKGDENLVRAYAEALDEIRKELKRIYRKYQEDGILPNGDKTVYNRLKQLENQIKDILNRKNIEVDELIERLTAEQFEESFYRMAYSFDEGTGISWDWGLIPEEAVDELVHSPLEKLFQSEAVRKARDGAFERIRRDLELAIIRGDSFQTLARRIAKSIGVDNTGNGYSYGRRGLTAKAMTIARNEGMRALNAGHQRAYKEAEENGIKLAIMWDATLDSRTRPSHGALDGQYKDKEHDGWYVPELGKYVSGPGQSGVASFDINCRCRTHASITGELPENRYIRGKSTTEPYITYSDWLKQKAKQGVNADPEMEEAIKDFQKYMIKYHQESFVIIDTAGKLDGYALNINHPRGGSHARVIRRAFGLSDGDGEYLEKQIRQNLIRATIKEKQTANFGRIYNAFVPITGKNGNEEEIEVGFIVDFPDERFDGNTARLTTVYMRGRK